MPALKALQDLLCSWHTHHGLAPGPRAPLELMRPCMIHMFFDVLETPFKLPIVFTSWVSLRMAFIGTDGWLRVKTNGIPFWLVGEFTTRSRTYLGWIG